MQKSKPTDTLQMFQDGSKVRFSFFLPIRPDNPDLFPLMLDLMATSNADQICVSLCRQYILNVETQGMEEEHGVLVSVVLPDIREAQLSVNEWAIRAAKYLDVKKLRFVAHEVFTISTAAEQQNDALQLSFDGW